MPQNGGEDWHAGLRVLWGWEDPTQMLVVPPTSSFWGSSDASNSLITAKLSRHLPSAADPEPGVVWQLPGGFRSQTEPDAAGRDIPPRQ